MRPLRALDIYPPLDVGAHADRCTGVLVSQLLQHSGNWLLLIWTCPVCGHTTGEHAVALIDQTSGQAVPLSAPPPAPRRPRIHHHRARKETP